MVIPMEILLDYNLVKLLGMMDYLLVMLWEYVMEKWLDYMRVMMLDTLCLMLVKLMDFVMVLM